MLKLLHTQITQSTFNMDHTLNLNLMVAPTMIGSLHTFQPTTLILRSMMLEPRLLQPLRLKPLQLEMLLRPSDGTSQLGTNLDHPPHSETLLKIDLMVAHTTIGSLLMFQQIMLTQRCMTLEPKLLQLLKPKLLQLVMHLRPSDGTSQLGTNLDHLPLSEILLNLNSIPDQAETGTLHTFQPTMLTQRSMTLEPKPPQLLKLKPHQLVMPLRPSDGTSQLGINLALPYHSETLFNLILKISLVLASRELLTSKCHQPPTLAQTPTKQPLMTRTAQLTETPPGTPSLPQEPPSQRTLRPLHSQDTPSTDFDCVR